jgi:hypothetical protein
VVEGWTDVFVVDVTPKKIFKAPVVELRTMLKLVSNLVDSGLISNEAGCVVTFSEYSPPPAAAGIENKSCICDMAVRLF